MKTLLVLVFASYLVTWLSGVYMTRQKSIKHETMRKIHFGCTLVTCVLLTTFVVKFLMA